jgi:hypothetical protein
MTFLSHGDLFVFVARTFIVPRPEQVLSGAAACGKPPCTATLSNIPEGLAVGGSGSAIFQLISSYLDLIRVSPRKNYEALISD